MNIDKRRLIFISALSIIVVTVHVVIVNLVSIFLLWFIIFNLWKYNENSKYFKESDATYDENWFKNYTYDNETTTKDYDRGNGDWNVFSHNVSMCDAEQTTDKCSADQPQWNIPDTDESLCMGNSQSVVPKVDCNTKEEDGWYDYKQYVGDNNTGDGKDRLAYQCGKKRRRKDTGHHEEVDHDEYGRSM